jgi:hypothetical protein
MLSAIKINAKNDANGNPRRGWVILNTAEGFTNILDFVDEGYEGPQAVVRAGYPRSLADSPEFDVVPSEYRQMLQLADRIRATS